MSLRGACIALVAISAALLVASSVWGGIASSKHNLSASGPGSVKASSETQICLFCHAPHNSSPTAPLWNRQTPGSTYTPYISSTTKAATGQPTGGSLLCLSCHDGTIALGQLLNRATPISMVGGVTTMPAGSASRLGTDLSGDHPISFAYTSALAASRGELVAPSALTGAVRLDGSGQMQCSACHDAHNDVNGKFLVMPNTGSALCQTCHLKNYWSGSEHRLSSKTWNGIGPNPWPHTSGSTVAANACENCHQPHSAPGKKWLQNAATEEGNCYPCHNANVATKNIQTEFNKSSIHPIASSTGIHDPAEAGVVNARHVECVDCHNPHASNSSVGALPGSLVGVRGIGINGIEVNPSTAEYQICFRCHGDSLNKPAPKTARISGQNNTRLDFLTSNKSCHSVAGTCSQITPASVLVAPWTSASILKCSDCHNNNAGPGNGGSGPAGPHGSSNPSLLERSYTGTKPAMCAKCHTTNYVKFNGDSSHRKHTGDIGATCNTCHDPHGSSSYPSMINFDTSLVTFRSFTPASPGQANNGSCNLTCHGKNHGSSCTYTGC